MRPSQESLERLWEKAFGRYLVEGKLVGLADLVEGKAVEREKEKQELAGVWGAQ